MSIDFEARSQIAGLLRRVSLADIDVAAAQHTVRATGLKGEEVLAPRHKEFGFSSSPPPGSVGLLASLGGRSDRGMILGLDHPAYGPRDLGMGESAIYNAHGDIVSLVQRRVRIVSVTVEVVASAVATISAPQVVVTSPDIRLGSAAASQRVAIEGGYANKVRAE